MVILILSYLIITVPFKDYPRGLWIFLMSPGIHRLLAWDPHGVNGYFFLTRRQKKTTVIIVGRRVIRPTAEFSETQTEKRGTRLLGRIRLVRTRR